MDKTIQFPCEEDGCIYFYDDKKDTWKKICDISSPQELPESVKIKIADMQRTTI